MKSYRCLTIFLLALLFIVGCSKPPPEPVVMKAVTDFDQLEVDGFVPYYIDGDRLAIDAAKYPDRYAAAATTFTGKAYVYNVMITTVTENDGESSYRLKVNGKEAFPMHQNPRADGLSTPMFLWQEVAVPDNALIQVESNAHSNGFIPEGDGYAYAHGRWIQLEFQPLRPIQKDDEFEIDLTRRKP